jgi:catechol 2,3-dioxygenase-like lactoylglutathione lyase family enzyme
MLEGKVLPMLYVKSVPRSVEFYRDLLGFDFIGWWSESGATYVPDQPAGGPPDFAELVAGDLVLHLHAAPSLPDPTPAPDAILHVRVENADAYHEQVSARGGTFEPPRDQPWGWRQFYARDPDGHQWSFYHLLAGGSGE